jgi:sugar phosphate isomerase/epimerase
MYVITFEVIKCGLFADDSNDERTNGQRKLHDDRGIADTPHTRHTDTMPTARELGPNDLVWDHFSRPRHDDVVARIHAAAAAGYAGIGLYFGAWETLRDDAAALDRVDEALAATGLVVANIEVARGWASPDIANDTCTHVEQLAYEMADHWECRYLQVIGNYTGTLAEASVGFGALCDRAAEHGLLVGIEWVPSMTNIEDAKTAVRIALDADRANGGLCFDSWHLTRSTNNLDDLRAIPGEKIFATQWNDGTIEPQNPDYLQDCLSNRVPPGDGSFQLVDMVTILDSIGSVAPIGLEVCSTTLWEAPVNEAALVSAQGMRSILSAARTQ